MSNESWALDVGGFVRDMARRTPPPDVHELWLTAGHALCLRYQLREHRIAARFGRLDLDTTSGPQPLRASRQAADIYHNLHTDPGPNAWEDGDGYRWWGDEPDGGWASTLLEPRAATLVTGGT